MISKVFILTCDHCDESFPDMIESCPDTMKANAKENGWKIIGWSHFCPTCTATQEHLNGYANAR